MLIRAGMRRFAQTLRLPIRKQCSELQFDMARCAHCAGVKPTVRQGTRYCTVRKENEGIGLWKDVNTCVKCKLHSLYNV
jgi:hypothetical protein